MTVCFYL